MLKRLEARCGSLNRENLSELIVEASRLFLMLARLDMPKEYSDAMDDVDFNRDDPEVRREAVKAGLDSGLMSNQLEDLTGSNSEDEIEELIEDYVRKALWREIWYERVFVGDTSSQHHSGWIVCGISSCIFAL